MDYQKISLEKFVALFNPFESNIWVKVSSPLTVEEILKASSVSPDVPQQTELIWNVEDRFTHAGRVRWLIENWSDDYPIDIDFGMPNLGYPSSELICDGNHRLMAAIVLKRKWINANCSGEVNEIEKYLWEAKH